MLHSLAAPVGEPDSDETLRTRIYVSVELDLKTITTNNFFLFSFSYQKYIKDSDSVINVKSKLFNSVKHDEVFQLRQKISWIFIFE